MVGFGPMEYWKVEVPDHLKTQEACIEAVEKYSWYWGVFLII